MSSLNEHPAETQRAPASALLMIDSQDRFQIPSTEAIELWETDKALQTYAQISQPLNNFTIFKRQPFLTGYFTRVGVTEVRMEYCCPNINERNNAIQFVLDGDVEVIEIPPAFYTPSQLATQLESELESEFSGTSWTVTYEAELNYFKVVCNDNPSGDETFQIIPYDYTDVGGTNEQTLRGLYFMMNFSLATSLLGTSDTVYGQPFPALVYTRYIDICSRTLTNYQKVKDNSTRDNQTPAVLCRIYLGNYISEGVLGGSASTYPGSAPAVIHRIFNVPKYSQWSPGQFIDQIDIQLRDDAGNLLYIPSVLAGGAIKEDTQNLNACSFQMTLHASES
jgi:hypothetical protein